jgi:hypothetical protein
MIGYAFYWRDKKGENHLLGILPERRKNPERITQESVMNWGKQLVEFKDIFSIQVEIDEAQVKSWGLLPLSELKKKFKE